MGSSKQTSTQSTTIRGMGAQEREARNALEGLLSGQLPGGSLEQLLQGDFSVTPQDEDFIRQISGLTNQMQREQATANFEDMAGAVEGQLLDRGLEGSSIEAVNNAMLGRQLQQSLDQGSLQSQITSAQQLQQQTMNRAGIQLSANQLLLNQILSGAGALGNMGLQERLVQQTTTGETEQSGGLGSQIGGVLGTVGGAFLGGPAGAMIGSQLFGGGGGQQPAGGASNATPVTMPTTTGGYGPSSGYGSYGGQQSIVPQ